MKTVLRAAAVATLTLTSNLPAQADGADEIDVSSHVVGQREARHKREDRLRETTYKQGNRLRRETRHEREQRLREAGRQAGPGFWQDPI
ncbi:MAG: hypothetical protein IPK63_05590 [Candidatus Competibacteraceae bacterium]|nr:hypothetical protein [Candidatus Competibacteraceae bacterium]